ncbi:hypothetical protein ACQKOE_04165 [Novosphingobium sp. NPDC080210]|uniref:hypothetical protein n=1 Tax=unclassified Novosphingobium TaxID=2644732 RepID=UPI0035AFE346
MDWQATISDWLDNPAVRSGLVAFALVCLAFVAWRGDRRRMTRSDADAVGWMPWRDIAFWSAFIAFLVAVFGPYFL